MIVVFFYLLRLPSRQIRGPWFGPRNLSTGSLSMSADAPLSLVMVEDNLDLAETVEDFLKGEPRLKVAGIAHDSQGFRDQVVAHMPDLALIDIHLDTPRAGLDLLQWLRKH